MASLACMGLEKRFGDTLVLDGIDLEVSDGEYVVLVGPSGCGKSTLLRCIAGLETITSGALMIDGEPVHDQPPAQRDVAMVFQSYALYPHFTVAENIAFPLRVRGVAPEARAEAVAEVAGMLDLSELLERYPSQLSGGQRQRVAMGRAVVRRPRVFLFDEPLSNLDASLRHHMRVELKRLHRTLQATVVHVTHDQVEALTLADRIAILDRGVLQQVGTPREVFDTPANTFVATFIGSPSMVLLDGHGEGDHCTIRGTEARLPVAHDGPVTLGLRPTDVALAPAADSGAVGTVEGIESHGAEAMVLVALGRGATVLARAPEPVAVRMGDRVGLDVAVVHRFDATSGLRVEVSAA